MEKYITDFCRSSKKPYYMHAASTTEAGLPKLAKYMVNGLCYAYKLGKCECWICGKSLEGHALVSDINDSFAQALCNTLSKEVYQRLTTEPPTTQQDFIGGSHIGKQYKQMV